MHALIGSVTLILVSEFSFLCYVCTFFCLFRNNAVKVIRRSLNDIFKDSKEGNDKSIIV